MPKIGLEENDFYVGHDAQIQMINSENDSGGSTLDSDLSNVPIRCMGIVFETQLINSSEEEVDLSSPIKVHLVVAHNCTEIEQVLSSLKKNVLLFGIILSIFILISVVLIVSKSMKPVGLISNDIKEIKIVWKYN